MINQLTQLKDDTMVSQLSLLGTHDSATFGVKFPHKITSRCIFQNFHEQLEMDIRYFDIRLNLKKGQLTAYHGLADCHITWAEIQYIFRDFLINNPDEIIFVRILRADDTFKTNVSHELWDSAFTTQTLQAGVIKCFEDTSLKKLRGNIVCINYLFKKIFPYNSNDDYTLRANKKGIKAKKENIQQQINKRLPDNYLNLITFNSRGSLPFLPFIPYPERFAKRLSVNCSIPDNEQAIWCCFDFPEKFTSLFGDILKRNNKYQK